MSIYNISVKTTSGDEISMEKYRNKVILIVNTASKCGFTPQFKELEELYQKFKENDFVVLGFPCNQFLQQDPLGNDEIVSFCQINYGVTFPMFAKIDVNGPNESELFSYLKQAQKGKLGNKIKWNFTKFLVDKEGTVVSRFPPTFNPREMEPDIKNLLNY